ncbi:MAG: hypothetical protein MN733_05540 [Nitrososphaera sp.]|nr:hypothetical protein [Nitrososphaera sp.]
MRQAHQIDSSAFLALVNKTRALVNSILGEHTPQTDSMIDEASRAWLALEGTIEPTGDAASAQKN